MYSRLANSAIRLGGSRMSLFGRRFFADSASYNKIYNLINESRGDNSIFWGEIEDAVKKIEHADKNYVPITQSDLENISDIKYSLSRTYDHPASFERLEPLFEILNKADTMLIKSNKAKELI